MRFGDFFSDPINKDSWTLETFKLSEDEVAQCHGFFVRYWAILGIVFFSVSKKTRLLIKVDDEYIIKIIAMTIHSFKFWQTFFLVRQSGRVKRHAYSYVFLLRPPLPKARSRGGRQFFTKKIFQLLYYRYYVLKCFEIIEG